MSSYEYTVIPAPLRGEKTKGAKTGIERFAATLADTLNEMAREGWDYVRAETLPAEERSGLTSRTTVYHNLLVFRRSLAVLKSQTEPAMETQPTQSQPTAQPGPVSQASAAPSAALNAVANPAPIARGPFTAPMRPTPKLVEDNHARTRVSDPPLTAPEAPVASGPRLGPASR